MSNTVATVDVADPGETKLMALVRQSNETSDPNALISIGTALDRFSDDDLAAGGFMVRRLAVLTGYSSRFICDILKALLLREKIALRIYESEYGLFEQTIHQQAQELSEFGPHLVYLCVGREHLRANDAEAEADRWLDLCRSAHNFLSTDIVINTFESPAERIFGNFEAKAGGPLAWIRAINKRLGERAPTFVHLNDVEWLSSYWGKRGWRDDRLYDSSKIPVAFDNQVAYATNLADICRAIFGRSRKCLVLDLDNTLWGGVIGDDGLEGIRLGPDGGVGEAFHRFQKYIKELSTRGVVLAVCSKNDPEIAREAFDRHPDMVLGLDDISSFQASWDDKAQGLHAIAEELNLGLDSLVFVDDNPAERALVRQFVPDVAVVELPLDPSDYVAALSSSNLFDLVSITDEDRIRKEFYQANAQRSAKKLRAGSYDEYLDALAMRAIIAPIGNDNIVRVTQLINKTNQFNLTTPRYTQSEVSAMAMRADTLTLTIRLSDEFGDNGLICVFIALAADNVLTVDTWLMSCRVLKRNVEWLILQEAIRFAQSKGLETVVGPYRPTKKNKMVKDLYREFGFELTRPGSDVEYWSLSLKRESLVRQILDKNLHISKVT